METSARPIDPERPHAPETIQPSAAPPVAVWEPLPLEQWPVPEEDDFSKYDRPRITSRFTAFTADFSVLAISAYAMAGAYGPMMKKIIPNWVAFTFVFLIAFFLYSVLFEASPLRGTPGKRLMGYVVVDTKGNRLSFWRVLARNLLRPVSFLTGGFMMMLFSPEKQMLHDKIVGAIAEGLPPER